MGGGGQCPAQSECAGTLWRVVSKVGLFPLPFYPDPLPAGRLGQAGQSEPRDARALPSFAALRTRSVSRSPRDEQERLGKASTC